MSTFATVADMQARFEERDLIQLTDTDGAGVIDAAKIEQQLGSADAMIIGYIAARYRDTASFAGHQVLRDVACDYAFSLLWRSDLPEWVAQRRSAAIGTLTAISKGTIKLDQGEEQAVARPDAIIVSGPERNFSRDRLAGY